MAMLSPMIPLATGVERTSPIEVFGFQRFADLLQIAHPFIAPGIPLGSEVYNFDCRAESTNQAEFSVDL